MDGLNRDPSQALKTEQTANVNIDWQPAFNYVKTMLDGWGVPSLTTGTFDFFADPKGFLNDIQDNLAKSIPLLKRPEQKKESPSTPTAQAPNSEATPSVPAAPGAVQR